VKSWPTIFQERITNEQERSSWPLLPTLRKILKGDAQAAVDAVFSVITDELKRGGDVRLVGLAFRRLARRLDRPQSADRSRGQDSCSFRAEILGWQGPQGRGQLIATSMMAAGKPGPI
jgi:nucleoid DNA-binding protein